MFLDVRLYIRVLDPSLKINVCINCLFSKFRLYTKAHVASLLQSYIYINYMFFDVKFYIKELVTHLQRDSIITCMFLELKLDI
jgi:hypothetical protein